MDGAADGGARERRRAFFKAAKGREAQPAAVPGVPQEPATGMAEVSQSPASAEPARPNDPQRRRPVRIDLLPRDYERLTKAARRLGLSRSACVRMTILSRLARADAEMDLWSAP